MELSTDEQSLLVVGLAYLLIAVIWVFTFGYRAKIMLRAVRDRVDPELWRELGAPETLSDIARDPERRWRKFLRGGDYRRRCGTDVVEIIDDFRRRLNYMFVVLGIAAAAILYRYRDLLLPALLGR